MMKILIINPNSDPKMTEEVQNHADNYSICSYQMIQIHIK